MGRADRHNRLLALLRRRRQTTAAELAAHLQVSERTVYRDVAALVDSGVDIRGEAGVGYRLERGGELRPVVLDVDEVQALVFGARLVERTTDAALRHAARSAIDKLYAVLPQGQREWLESTPMYSPPPIRFAPDRVANLQVLRDAIRRRVRVSCGYVNARDERTERTLVPLGLWLWTEAWTLGAWCCLREQYRSFRVDRISELVVWNEPVDEDARFTVPALLEAVRPIRAQAQEKP